MNRIFLAVKCHFKNNFSVWLGALIVGAIYLLPILIYIFSFGDIHQNVPLMLTPNEDAYLARMQEILDGHFMVGSPFFYEYKNQWPLMPPVGEMLYVLPTLLFGVSLVKVFMAAKVILPVLLFLLIYFLIRRLTTDNNSLSNRINAAAGGFWVVLGYDSVDYHTLWLFLTGKQMGSSLIWSRPVNPILGGIFLFLFLLLVWRILNNVRIRKGLIILASFIFLLMMGNYFFSWGLALAILAVLFLGYLLAKDYEKVRKLSWLSLSMLFFSLPYWYFVWQSRQSPWYQESVLRTGLIETHYPMMNKLMLAVFLFFVSLILLQMVKKIKNSRLKWGEAIQKYFSEDWHDWHWFCLAFIVGSFVAYNQQVITGITVWPFHFVQFTIPLSMIIICVLFYNLIKPTRSFLWKIFVTITISASIILGVTVQTNKNNSFDHLIKIQSHYPLFDWLNKQEKDCVVLVNMVKENYYKGYALEALIPAFTHCNDYQSSWTFSVMPSERSVHNYLVLLRLNGIKSEEVEEYLKINRQEAAVYLSSNWKGLYEVKLFPDFSDEVFEERIKHFPLVYREFLAKDFKSELLRYRLDFILATGGLDDKVKETLPGLVLINNFDGMFIYKF